MGRAGRPVLLNSKLKREPAYESDGLQGAWSREQLERMDRRFVERLERAIRTGQEQPVRGTIEGCWHSATKL